MPELPEVETTRRRLLPVVVGKVMRTMHIRRRDLRWPVPDHIEQCSNGAKILDLDRRGKYLLWRLSGGWVQILHLGMSGRVLIVDHEAPIGRHDHIDWVLDDGKCIRLSDPRRFGSLDLVRDNAVFDHPRLAAMGPEPEDLTAERLFTQLSGRRSRLATLLLDQRLVAGLGNIYVNEACFRAGLSPLIEARHVSLIDCTRLVSEIQNVLKEAIAAGGSSLRNYTQTDGSLGYFSGKWRVYRREGEACQTCGAEIIRTSPGGRSLFYCPACQRSEA